MNQPTIKIFAPATVANLACGFDILGLALDNPGDVISVSLTSQPGMVIRNEVQGMNVPLDPDNNTTTVAIQAYLQHVHNGKSIASLLDGRGIEVVFHEKILPGSGLGSSSASAAAGIWGLNQLLGQPLTSHQLIEYGMQGERAACGTAHADNVAPALIGGIALIRGYEPLDIVPLSYPDSLHMAIIHPQIEVRTEDARNILPKQVNLRDAVKQWGNVAGLIAGLAQADLPLIGRSLHDVIVEPARASLIPGFYGAKQAALDAGALGCSISGSGPSIFALCDRERIAEKVVQAFANSYQRTGIGYRTYLSPISNKGVRAL